MDDTTIVQLYWDRDERAIPATSGKYGNYCNSIAWNILGNREDAEECVMDLYAAPQAQGSVRIPGEAHEKLVPEPIQASYRGETRRRRGPGCAG